MLRPQSRLDRRSAPGLRALEKATRRIEELDAILARQLEGEDRDGERLNHLRQATGQITRCANDGIQAYRRVAAALRAEAANSDADDEEVAVATQVLADARARMMTALEVASRRYPWAAPWNAPPGE